MYHTVIFNVSFLYIHTVFITTFLLLLARLQHNRETFIFHLYAAVNVCILYIILKHTTETKGNNTSAIGC
jgi:hypothetical protein